MCPRVTHSNYHSGETISETPKNAICKARIEKSTGRTNPPQCLIDGVTLSCDSASLLANSAEAKEAKAEKCQRARLRHLVAVVALAATGVAAVAIAAAVVDPAVGIAADQVTTVAAEGNRRGEAEVGEGKPDRERILQTGKRQLADFVHQAFTCKKITDSEAETTSTRTCGIRVINPARHAGRRIDFDEKRIVRVGHQKTKGVDIRTERTIHLIISGGTEQVQITIVDGHRGCLNPERNGHKKHGRKTVQNMRDLIHRQSPYEDIESNPYDYSLSEYN